jgi:hypothetical protein
MGGSYQPKKIYPKSQDLAAQLKAQMDALPKNIKAKIASGELKPQYQTKEIGPPLAKGKAPVAAYGITGFTSNAPNNSVNFYNLDGNLVKTVQRSTDSGGLFGGLFDAISGEISHIGDVVSNDPVAKAVAAVGLAIATGGASSAFSASLLESGIVSSAAVANAAAAAIVNTGVQTALGVPFEKAAENALLNFATGQIINPAISAEVKSVISSPTAASMATSAGTSIVNGVLRGQTGDEIAKSAIGAATGVLAGSVSKDVGDKVLSSIDDPTIAKIASDAAKGATSAVIKGQDVGKAVTSATQEDLLNAAGNVIGKNLPSGSNIDLSGVKEAIAPISKAATDVLQPVEGAIKGAAQKASDVATSIAQPISDAATKVLQPAEGAIKGAYQSASDALTSATKPIGDALSSAGDSIKNAVSDSGIKIPTDSFDKSVIDLMGKAPTANQPAISNVAAGGEGSASAYGGADVAMLGDTSQAGLGSKVSKKGGKYPWGEPEGTTALKEGLGV